MWSEVMFWLIFGVSCYWYITFKIENQAYVLLFDIDDEGNWLPFVIVFGIVASLKLIFIFIKFCE